MTVLCYNPSGLCYEDAVSTVTTFCHTPHPLCEKHLKEFLSLNDLIPELQIVNWGLFIPATEPKIKNRF